jgi:hypothetical protein
VDECAEGRHNCDPATSECVNLNAMTAIFSPSSSSSLSAVGRGFECRCLEGFEGRAGQCVDVDECQRGLARCHPNALCRNKAGTFSCQCSAGYRGDGFNCSRLFG